MSDANGDNLHCLVGRLRSRFGLPESVCSDAELLRGTEGTYGRALVEMGIAVGGLRAAIRAALPVWLRWIIPPNAELSFKKGAKYERNE